MIVVLLNTLRNMCPSMRERISTSLFGTNYSFAIDAVLEAYSLLDSARRNAGVSLEEANEVLVRSLALVFGAIRETRAFDLWTKSGRSTWPDFERHMEKLGLGNLRLSRKFSSGYAQMLREQRLISILTRVIAGAMPNVQHANRISAAFVSDMMDFFASVRYERCVFFFLLLF